jgi:hypothetical protein
MWRDATVKLGRRVVTHDAIAIRAYLKSLQHPDESCAERDWAEAESELMTES